MGVRRIRTVRDQRRAIAPLDTDPELTRYDGFSLQLAGRRGIMSYHDDGSELGDWPCRVASVDLDIPGLEFPVDLSRGVERFRSRRLRISSVKLGVDSQELARYLYEAAPFVSHVEFCFERDLLSVAADIEVDGVAVPITCRVLAQSGAEGGLTATAFWAYTEDANLGQRAIDRVREYLPREGGEPLIAASSLLRPLLVELFPVRGWRLPQFDGLRVRDIGGFRDNGTVEFALWSDRSSAGSERFSVPPGPDDVLAALLERFSGSVGVDEELEALSLLFRNGNNLEKRAAAKRLSTVLESGGRQTPQLLEGLVDYLPGDPIIFEKYVRASARGVERDVLLSYIKRWHSHVTGAGERVYSLVRAGEILLSEASLPEDAYHYFEKASLADPRDFDANFGMALAQSALGKYHRAEAILDRLEAQVSDMGHPAKMARIIAAHGELSMAQRRLSSARGHFERALELDPTLEWAQSRMAQLDADQAGGDIEKE